MYSLTKVVEPIDIDMDAKLSHVNRIRMIPELECHCCAVQIALALFSFGFFDQRIVRPFHA